MQLCNYIIIDRYNNRTEAYKYVQYCIYIYIYMGFWGQNAPPPPIYWSNAKKNLPHKSGCMNKM